MYILGFSGCPRCHDSSAALLKDNSIIAMAEQERFSRHRHAHGEWPIEAIRFCLQQAHLEFGDVTYVAYPWNARLTASESMHTLDLGHDPGDLREVFESLGASEPSPPIYRVSHHVAHFANAYWLSGFPEAAGLVIDGRGEREATTLFHARKSKYTVIKQYSLLHSLGALYDAATECSGLEEDDAGKFMGLSAYGRPIRKIPITYDDGYSLLTAPGLSNIPDEAWVEQYRYLRRFMAEENYPYALGSRENIGDFADLACSVQRALEQAMLNLATTLRVQTGCRQLVISGGVGLNCASNTRLAQEAGFSEIFIPPMANDSGVALGAALDLARQLGFLEDGLQQSPLKSVNWGPEFTDDEIEAAISHYALEVSCMPLQERCEYVAERLALDDVIGWFQGRAEVGPRALGSRSILANPARRRTLNRVNRLKGREQWRPLAPAVLAEHFSNFFTNAPPSRFMLMTATVLEHQRNRVPAVVHVDGTSRPQIVESDVNSEFYTLIEAFYQRTNIPLVVNTSFNLAGAPMVNTPHEALASFLAGDIDLLCIGKYLVSKSRRNDRSQ
ncbi:7-O-carbamoyltransferase [Methylococcales bacterium]|nr:7-O-carbamoyltransferase [Methylococcales bacterium]